MSTHSRSEDAPLVLVADDDDGLRQALTRALGYEGFRTIEAATGHEALDAARSGRPAIIVLDITMPVPDGIQVVRSLRGQGDETPVLILSARDGLDDRVGGLEAGADDYLVKPFALPELVARLRCLLRRSPGATGVSTDVGSLRVDPLRRQAWVAGREVSLTRREFDLLAALARRPGIALSRRQLLEEVWGYTFEVNTNVVDVFVGYLRRKLEAGGEPRLLHTIRGHGFVLRAPSGP